MMFQPYSPNMYPQILFFFLPFCSSSVFFLLLFSSSSLYASLICSDLTLWLHSLCSLILPLLTLLHHFHLYPPPPIKRGPVYHSFVLFFLRNQTDCGIPRQFQGHSRSIPAFRWPPRPSLLSWELESWQGTIIFGSFQMTDVWLGGKGGGRVMCLRRIWYAPICVLAIFEDDDAAFHHLPQTPPLFSLKA